VTNAKNRNGQAFAWPQKSSVPAQAMIELTASRVKRAPAPASIPATNAVRVPAEDWVSIRDLSQFGLRLAEVAAQCGWKLRDDEGESLVCLRENYDKAPARLVRLVELGTPEGASRSEPFQRLRTWPHDDAILPSAESVEHEVLTALATATSDPDWWQYARLAVMTARGASLPNLVQTLYATALTRHPGMQLWAIEIDNRLIHRFAIMRALFAARETPDLLAVSPQEFSGFQAGRGQMPASLLGLGPYIEPCLLAGAPWAAGMVAPRHDGILVFLFAEPELSAEPDAPNLLAVSRPRSLGAIRTPRARAELRRTGSALALVRWWVEGIDRLLSQLTDPARYRDQSGDHDARAQVAAVMSLERLFATVQAVLAHDGDDFVRLRLFFDALDLAVGLRLGDDRSLKRHDWLERRLLELQENLPSDVASQVIPRCQLGLRGLDKAANGFFASRMDDGKIRLPRLGQSGIDEVAPGVAVSDYLQLVRNAVYSFLKFPEEPRSVALMASHDGILPAEIADLAWFYLVRLLAVQSLPRFGRHSASRSKPERARRGA